MERPKICIIQYNSSRFLTRVDRSARTLAEAGCDVVLVAIKDAETPAFEQRSGYVVKRVELKTRRLPLLFRPLRFLEAIWRTYAAARAERADVYDARDLFPLLVAHRAASRGCAKLVYDSDELNLDRNWTWSKRPLLRRLLHAYERHYIRKADAVITTDEGRADILAREYGIERPAVVLNVSDVIETLQPDEAFRAAALKGRRYLLIYQGGLVANRGLAELILAMRELENCALALVGFGNLVSDLAHLVDEEHLEGQVSIVDPVPFAQMMRYTAAADIGMIPIVGSCLSYVYAAPNKLFEDMMAGIPVVASDLPDMAAIVRGENVGTLIADPTDPASIAEAVRELLHGPESLEIVGARGRAAALERYNWEIERTNQLDVYAALGVPVELPAAVAAVNRAPRGQEEGGPR